ncbi:hypothetical protein [Sporisorium scitamineum]|uniref:Uncharacterized protein n=1 Tax=Sporisorium scitamineum TaxID=49012 RepID=A0A0F7S661_9BASI|nr:hypothetical protein [Sporisorium scitamineum]
MTPPSGHRLVLKHRSEPERQAGLVCAKQTETAKPQTLPASSSP